jgi:DNA-binding Lrp family transcriptional regulator
VFSLDSVDIAILKVLEENCRASYQEMSRKFGMSANAVKKRVKKLVETGIIHGFVVYLSPAMADVEVFFTVVEIEQTKKQENVLDLIIEDSHVFSAGSLSDGTCLAFAEYEGSENEEKLRQMLQEIDGIKIVEIHKLLLNMGKKVEFKPLHLRVLRCLLEDPRMPATEVASITGLTPRRVRKIIGQLVEGQGVSFATRINLNAGPGVVYYVQLICDETEATHDDVDSWLEKEFSGHYFGSYISVSTPMMLSLFVIDHLREAELFTSRISQGSMIKSVKTIFPFPTRKDITLQRVKLEELLIANE